jgi:hypothetical protein
MKIASSFVLIICATCVGFAQTQQKDRPVLVVKEFHVDFVDSLMTKKVDQKKLQQGWVKLKTGMTEPQVRNLLGKPLGIFKSEKRESNTWDYGTKKVVFDAAKKTFRFKYEEQALPGNILAQ